MGSESTKGKASVDKSVQGLVVVVVRFLLELYVCYIPRVIRCSRLLISHLSEPCDQQNSFIVSSGFKPQVWFVSCELPLLRGVNQLNSATCTSLHHSRVRRSTVAAPRVITTGETHSISTIMKTFFTSAKNDLNVEAGEMSRVNVCKGSLRSPWKQHTTENKKGELTAHNWDRRSYGGNSWCERATQRTWDASLKNSEALQLVGEFGIFEFFGHRRQTSMTRATVEDSTAGLGQTLRTGRLVLPRRLGTVHEFTTAHGLPGGIQHKKVTDAGLGSLDLRVELLVTRTPVWMQRTLITTTKLG